MPMEIETYTQIPIAWAALVNMVVSTIEKALMLLEVGEIT